MQILPVDPDAVELGSGKEYYLQYINVTGTDRARPREKPGERSLTADLTVSSAANGRAVRIIGLPGALPSSTR